MITLKFLRLQLIFPIFHYCTLYTSIGGLTSLTNSFFDRHSTQIVTLYNKDNNKVAYLSYHTLNSSIVPLRRVIINDECHHLMNAISLVIECMIANSQQFIIVSIINSTLWLTINASSLQSGTKNGLNRLTLGHINIALIIMIFSLDKI